MLFLFISVWIVGLLFLIADPKRSSNRWASATAFCGGFGGLSVVIEEQITPYVLQHFQLVYLEDILLLVENGTSIIQHYGMPYCFLIFAMVYSELFSRATVRLVTLSAIIPGLIMAWLFPIYPVLNIPYPLVSLWVGPYMIAGIVFLIRACRQEKNMEVKRKRIFVNMAFIPVATVSLITNYILRSFDINEAWRYNGWVIVFAVTVILIAMLRFGFLGLRVYVQKQQLDHSMEVAASGTVMFQHALKNDIDKIKFMTHKLLHEAKSEGIEELQSDVEMIQQAQQRMEHTFNEVKKQMSDRDLQFASHRLIDIIEHGVKQLQPKLGHIEVTIDCDDDISIHCDRFHMEEVMYNIFSNAIEAMPQGGELTILGEKNDKFVRLLIKDTGIGIAKELSAKVFVPFFTTKPKEGQNMGLGLAYCHKIIEKHGGSIRLESEEDQGTEIWIELPV